MKKSSKKIIKTIFTIIGIIIVGSFNIIFRSQEEEQENSIWIIVEKTQAYISA